MYIYRKRACELEIQKRVNGSDLIKASYEKNQKIVKNYSKKIELIFIIIQCATVQKMRDILNCTAERERAPDNKHLTV